MRGDILKVSMNNQSKPYLFVMLAIVVLAAGITQVRGNRTYRRALPLVGLAPAPATSEQQIITHFDPSLAVDYLKTLIKQNGGNFDTQSIRLTVGYSTGIFGSEPVEQQAMFDTGLKLLNELRPGDHVSLFGFELEPGPAVWNLPEAGAMTHLAAVQGQLKAHGGGLDFNTAIHKAISLTQAGVHSNTVIAIITQWGTNESAAHPTKPGKFADLSQADLKKARLSRSLPLPVTYFDRDSQVIRRVYVTFVISNPFSGSPLPTPRSTPIVTQPSIPVVAPPVKAAPAPSPVEVSQSSGQGGIGVVVTLVLVLVTLGLGFGFIALRPRAPKNLSIALKNAGRTEAERQFPGKWQPNKVICRIVGNDVAPQENVADIILQSMSGVVAAEFKWDGNRMLVLSKYEMVDQGTSKTFSGTMPVTVHNPQVITIEGEQSNSSGFAADHFKLELEVNLT